MFTKTGQSMLNSQGYQDNKAPPTPGARLDQPHGLDCDQRISKHAQGKGGKVNLDDFISCDPQDNHQRQVCKSKTLIS